MNWITNTGNRTAVRVDPFTFETTACRLKANLHLGHQQGVSGTKESTRDIPFHSLVNIFNGQHICFQVKSDKAANEA